MARQTLNVQNESDGIGNSLITAKQSQLKKTRGVRSQKPDVFTFGAGRRREAVARVRLYESSKGVNLYGQQFHSGDIIVNGMPYGKYFNYYAYAPYFHKFIDSTDTKDKFIFSAKVRGGGKKGQIGAILHGMARALDKFDKEKYHKILRTYGYLTRDSRTRERRKVGMGGKARRKKQSPKR